MVAKLEPRPVFNAQDTLALELASQPGQIDKAVSR